MKRADAGSQLAELGARYALGPGQIASLEKILAGLAAEAAPPTTASAPGDAVRVHIADSLVGLEVESLRSATRIADLGAGAGFPGLVLAAVLPGASVELVESTRRKCDLIDRLAARAGLGNARAVPLRAEEVAANPQLRGTYDIVTARALASLPVLAEYAAPLLREGGSLVAWKGTPAEAEIRAGERACEALGMAAARTLPVEPYEGSRGLNLYVYSKVKVTPQRFPRRPGIAQKRPLG